MRGARVWMLLMLCTVRSGAETVADCNTLPDGQRLECYDRVLGVPPPSPEEVKRRTEPCADKIQRYREDEYKRAQRREPSAPPPLCMVEMNRSREEEMARERAAAVEREKKRAEEATAQLVACGRSPVTQRAILDGRLIIGMTAEEARCALRYTSIRVNRTTSIYGVSEQWVVNDGWNHMRYVYFNDGILTTIQE